MNCLIEIIIAPGVTLRGHYEGDYVPMDSVQVEGPVLAVANWIAGREMDLEDLASILCEVHERTANLEPHRFSYGRAA